ncbi:MAG: cobalt-precorrin-5B (C(1))-methyltransferase [Desulfobulbaceae bacterium]|nr:cobalt-precorrin-5B (C(1))-methyltransferase [Desulfobulbaceae bacterium]
MKNGKRKKKLRSGFTTGACAAAAAKAATILLLTSVCPRQVDIPFPDGKRFSFQVYKHSLSLGTAHASIIKDAGDDPDVTNGAEICAQVCIEHSADQTTGTVHIHGGVGVGRVTKPGLAAAVGGAAINPVPCQMIRAAVLEATREHARHFCHEIIEVTISIPEGERLAEKTLNNRLGIVGGLSILGTTGIVRPISASAWTATITASMDVAKEAGLREIVLSTGRTSEKAVQKMLSLPEEAYAMMGDYLEFSLLEAAAHDFQRIHLAAMWAKVLKAAMKIPQTHVSHGALEVDAGIDFLRKNDVEPSLCKKLKGSNTAREIYFRLLDLGRKDVVTMVCLQAKSYAERTSGLPVTVYLVDSDMAVAEEV